MPRSFKTTPAHFQTFEAECRRLVSLWGVNDWDCHFDHRRLKDDPEKGPDFAETDLESTGRAASFTLNIKWPKPVSDHELQDTAREEVVHLILGELTTLAFARHATEDQIEAALEGAVKRLKNLLPR